MRSILTILAVFSTVLPAAAQDASDWSKLETMHRVVYVTTDTGLETSGRLLRADATSLTLREGTTERVFPRDQVLFVEKRDSLKNGLIIGLAIGGGLGILGAEMSDCGRIYETRACDTGERAAILAVSVGVYTGISVGIDAMIRGRTRIYRRSVRPYAVRVGPILWSHTLGAAASFAW